MKKYLSAFLLSSVVGSTLAVIDAREAMYDSVLTRGRLVIEKIDWPEVRLEDETPSENWNRPLGRGKFLEAGVNINEEFNYQSELLMLARTLYSESKRAQEQYHIAWVIRNRVESGYRGESSYRAVTLDPMQFSAFNNPEQREGFLKLDFETENRIWQKTLNVARKVIRAPYEDNPLPEDALHFYAPRSMVGSKMPRWARGRSSLNLSGINPWRLQVFRGVS